MRAGRVRLRWSRRIKFSTSRTLRSGSIWPKKTLPGDFLFLARFRGLATPKPFKRERHEFDCHRDPSCPAPKKKRAAPRRRRPGKRQRRPRMLGPSHAFVEGGELAGQKPVITSLKHPPKMVAGARGSRRETLYGRGL